jgi:hypothetical protein
MMDISIKKAKVIYFLALRKGVLNHEITEESDDEELSLNPSISPLVETLDLQKGKVVFV